MCVWARVGACGSRGAGPAASGILIVTSGNQRCHPGFGGAVGPRHRTATLLSDAGKVERPRILSEHSPVRHLSPEQRSSHSEAPKPERPDSPPPSEQPPRGLPSPSPLTPSSLPQAPISPHNLPLTPSFSPSGPAPPPLNPFLPPEGPNLPPHSPLTPSSLPHFPS